MKQSFVSSPDTGSQPAKASPGNGALAFRWKYISVPLAILLLTVILIAYFYHRLPASVAYHFNSDGLPDRWLNREVVAFGLLILQLFIVLAGAVLVWGMTRLGVRFRQTEGTAIEAGEILSVMGNMVGLPQAILCFATFDIFSYNSYQIHILPLWVFALVVAILGGIIIGVSFFLAIRRALKTSR